MFMFPFVFVSLIRFARRFLMQVADASFQFEMVLDDLQRDAWPVPADQRVARCTGVALQVRQHPIITVVAP